MSKTDYEQALQMSFPLAVCLSYIGKIGHNSEINIRGSGALVRMYISADDVRSLARRAHSCTGPLFPFNRNIQGA